MLEFCKSGKTEGQKRKMESRKKKEELVSISHDNGWPCQKPDLEPREGKTGDNRRKERMDSN